MASEAIKMSRPRLYSLYIKLSIIYNNVIVVVGFAIFLAIIATIERSLMNAISQMILLLLMCIYLAYGTKALLKSWNFLIVYQAFVLTVLVLVQIMTQSKGIDNSRLEDIYEDMTPFWKGMLVIYGLVKYNEPIWLHLLPYVVLFSLSFILLA